MYTLIDMHWTEGAQGELFTKNSEDKFEEFVDWCHAGNVPTIKTPSEFYFLDGIHKGRNYKRIKMTVETIQERQSQYKANVMSSQGDTIEQLCKDVLKYINGKSNTSLETEADIDAMEVALAPILKALGKNRYKAAKKLIDEIVTDKVFFTNQDKKLIKKLFKTHLKKINKLKALVS